MEEPTLIGHRRVRPDCWLFIAHLLDLRDQRAGDAQPADRILILELEAELLRVVVDILHLLELQWDEALVAASEDLLRVECGRVADNVLRLVCYLGNRLAGERVVACARRGADTEAGVEEGVAAAGFGSF